MRGENARLGVETTTRRDLTARSATKPRSSLIDRLRHGLAQPGPASWRASSNASAKQQLTPEAFARTYTGVLRAAGYWVGHVGEIRRRRSAAG